MQKINYKVQGMTCTACAKLVAMRIKKISGVISVNVDHFCGGMEISASRNILPEEVVTVLAGSDFSAIKI
jgi:copper chaperone CopZ